MKRSDVALLISELQKEGKRYTIFPFDFRYCISNDEISEVFSPEILEELEQIQREHRERCKKFSQKLLNEVIETLPKEE